MAEIEIYWDDLKSDKQREILSCLGENGNYDVIPIATIPHENDLARMIYEKVYLRDFADVNDRVNQEPVCFDEFLDNEWADEEIRSEYLAQAREQEIVDDEIVQAALSEFSNGEPDVEMTM